MKFKEWLLREYNPTDIRIESPEDAAIVHDAIEDAGYTGIQKFRMLVDKLGAYFEPVGQRVAKWQSSWQRANDPPFWGAFWGDTHGVQSYSGAGHNDYSSVGNNREPRFSRSKTQPSQVRDLHAERMPVNHTTHPSLAVAASIVSDFISYCQNMKYYANNRLDTTVNSLQVLANSADALADSLREPVKNEMIKQVQQYVLKSGVVNLMKDVGDAIRYSRVMEVARESK